MISSCFVKYIIAKFLAGLGEAIARSSSPRTGVYQRYGEQHLQRYLAEFDFRYNGRKVTDSERTENAIRGIVGKRLTYQQPCS